MEESYKKRDRVLEVKKLYLMIISITLHEWVNDCMSEIFTFVERATVLVIYQGAKLS